ncbi:DNA alkylation repair protein [Promicromonospora thailandica]|uniref:3-methyladenine DNA glycosylase AlkC n=1 Tax=Promicromonospora thailandica TaxID=765201 RepID=A0A9X2GDH8_9MICO|nr:DNA alkylation repair protein [Promicromonospora thailandica]MCP2267191.1 3-methyladenine DNA glycosylase AlkC [Promicromonospora thailandica]
MPFADEMIGTSTVAHLVASVASALPGAPLTVLRGASARIAGLALRERVDLLEGALLTDVPGRYPGLAEAVRAALDGPVPLHGWAVWPVSTAVAAAAVEDGTPATFDDAVVLLERLTGVLTSEFAIRTLINHDPDRALAAALAWTASPDEHVRRLASEGTRPYLPWAIRVPALSARGDATLPVLDALYRDPSEYVRRSVANHLNDLSRDHPGLVVRTAARWLADPAPDGSTPRLVRHALRTLVKKGDPGALALLGYASPAALTIDGPHLDRTVVETGGTVELRALLRNDGEAAVRLLVDYVVHHRKANGTQTPKTFKLTTVTLEPGQSTEVRRAHSFREITTRRYHPGAHAVALQVNGVLTEAVAFEVVGREAVAAGEPRARTA